MGLQFKRERVERLPYRPDTEPQPDTEGAGPRGALLRALRGADGAHTLPGSEEGRAALRQGTPRKSACHLCLVRPEHRPNRRGARENPLLAAWPLVTYSAVASGPSSRPVSDACRARPPELPGIRARE